MHLKLCFGFALLAAVLSVSAGCQVWNAEYIHLPDPLLSGRVKSPNVTWNGRTGESQGASRTDDEVMLAAYGSRPSPHESEHLSVLSFNLKNRKRLSELELFARQLKQGLSPLPDFVLLQEVKYTSSVMTECKNTACALASLLGYQVNSTKRSSDKQGLAILSRFPFDYYAHRELEAQTNRFLLGFNRVSVMGEFIVPDVGRVRVVNVHFTNWDFEEHIRYRQLRETLEWIVERDRRVHAEVTILGGDFNFDPDDREFSLIENQNADEGVQFMNRNTDDPTKRKNGRLQKRVDYIFISAPDHEVFRASERRLWKDGMYSDARHHRVLISDHVPLLHEYEIRSPAKEIASIARPTDTN